MAERRIGRLRGLPEPERSAFAAWLAEWRKACPLMEGVPESEQDAYFVSDFDHFREVRGATRERKPGRRS